MNDAILKKLRTGRRWPANCSLVGSKDELKCQLIHIQTLFASGGKKGKKELEGAAAAARIAEFF
jgi:hypothetical protein